MQMCVEIHCDMKYCNTIGYLCEYCYGEYFNCRDNDWLSDLKKVQPFANVDRYIERLGLEYFKGGIGDIYYMQRSCGDESFLCGGCIAPFFVTCEQNIIRTV